MINSCKIVLKDNHILITDMINNSFYNSGILEVDFAIAYYVAKSNYHIVTIDESIIDYVNNSDIYYWHTTHYGEFISKLPKVDEYVAN